MPDQGPGNKKLYIIFDSILLALTILLLISLMRIPIRYKNRRSRSVGGIAILHFIWPIVVFYAALRVPDWKVLVMMYEPGLGYWLLGVALIVFIKGVVEIAMIALRRKEF
jgi:hypothetical protein